MIKLRAAVFTACLLFSFIAASCSSPGYEYYLTQDATHKDVYSITASISSDGTCSFSVDGDESDNYGNLYWTDPEELKSIEQVSKINGSCENASREPTTELEPIHVPRMFVVLHVQQPIDPLVLKLGIPLAVNPVETYTPSNQPLGVLFSIGQAKFVKQYKFAPCGTEVASLKGDAHLQSMPTGVVTLSISALGYPKRAGC